MKCEKCSKGWPDARTDIYWGPDGPHRLCDPCLLADVRAEAAQQPPVARPAVDEWVAESNREALMLGEITLADLTSPPF